MARKLLNLVTNNIGLKLISIVLASVLWLIVVNVDNPQTTVSFSATAGIINESIIKDNGKVYEVLDDTNTIRFSVTGPRSIVEGLSASDFSVIADMNKIDLSLGLIPVEVTPERYANKLSVSVKTTNVHVSIEDVKTQQFAITAVATGEPRTGYALGEVTPDPATVTISGPETVIGRIDRVVANVEIDGFYATRNQVVVPKIYDKEGKRIISSNVVIEPGTVQVTAKILETKSIGIRCENPTGLPEGYAIESIVCLPETIQVKGSKEKLEDFNELVIPSSALNINGSKNAVEKKITITSYLPEGVELVDDTQTNIVVKIEISSSITKKILVPVSQIIIEGLGEGLEVLYSQKTIEVEVEGERSVVDGLDKSMIKLRIDFSGMKEGSFRLVPEPDEITGVTRITVSAASGSLKKQGSPEPDNPEEPPNT